MLKYISKKFLEYFNEKKTIRKLYKISIVFLLSLFTLSFNYLDFQAVNFLDIGRGWNSIATLYKLFFY